MLFQRLLLIMYTKNFQVEGHTSNFTKKHVHSYVDVVLTFRE